MDKIFNHKAGDKMPPADGKYDDGMPFAIVSSQGKDNSVHAVLGTEKTGICGVRAIWVINNDNNGEKIKDKMKKAERGISDKYGKPNLSPDGLDPGAIHDGSIGFMKSLEQNEREYMRIWKVDKGGISVIVLSAHGLNANDGYYEIVYRFANYDANYDEARREVNSGL